MAPHINEPAGVTPSKKGALDHDSVPRPVADDFMYDFKYNHDLPTSSVLGVEVPADCNAQKEAENIMASLSEATSKEDAKAFTDLFFENGRTFDDLINESLS